MKDNLIPPATWEFDKAVTDRFDDMLRRSIPQYEVMRKAVFDMASPYVKPRTRIVDLGCSRGEALAPFVAHFGTANDYIGIDISKPMLEAAQDRFEKSQEAGSVEIIDYDLRNPYTITNASLTLSVLTLQFIPVEYRAPLVKSIYANTVAGGAFILVEKLVAAAPGIAGQMIDNYHAMKRENGYSAEQIEKKRLALEGVLVPLTAKDNEALLVNAGFAEVECFWRWMNFAGWIALKK